MSLISLETVFTNEAAQRHILEGIADALHNLSVQVACKPKQLLIGSEINHADRKKSKVTPTEMAANLDRQAGHVQTVARSGRNPLIFTFLIIIGMFLFPRLRAVISAGTITRVSDMYFNGVAGSWDPFELRIRTLVFGVKNGAHAKSAIEIVINERILFTRIKTTPEHA